ncbi:MAG TPA: hypothetical protein VHS06_06115 [Chloroflexota bacterium]|nr:hypothetical protein [Chloroflexota bacterium]
MVRFEVVPRCNGCKSCEMACSFRATGCFWPPASAIHTRRTGSKGAYRYEIGIDADECDLCENEAIALCQKACGPCILTGEVISRIRGEVAV